VSSEYVIPDDPTPNTDGEFLPNEDYEFRMSTLSVRPLDRLHSQYLTASRLAVSAA